MPRTESTAAFKKFSSSPHLEESRLGYAHDAGFKGFVKLLSAMLPDTVTPTGYCDLCEELLSLSAQKGDRRRREIESLVARLVVYMQACSPTRPKLFTDRFTNATITHFAKRYLQERGGERT